MRIYSRNSHHKGSKPEFHRPIAVINYYSDSFFFIVKMLHINYAKNAITNGEKKMKKQLVQQIVKAKIAKGMMRCKCCRYS